MPFFSLICTGFVILPASTFPIVSQPWVKATIKHIQASRGACWYLVLGLAHGWILFLDHADLEFKRPGDFPSCSEMQRCPGWMLTQAPVLLGCAEVKASKPEHEKEGNVLLKFAILWREAPRRVSHPLQGCSMLPLGPSSPAWSGPPPSIPLPLPMLLGMGGFTLVLPGCKI